MGQGHMNDLPVSDQVRPHYWPDQVNAQLSRHGNGLEAHERQIAELTRQVTELIRRLEADEQQIADLLALHGAGLASHL